jgi:hypothetical protein
MPVSRCCAWLLQLLLLRQLLLLPLQGRRPSATGGWVPTPFPTTDLDLTSRTLACRLSGPLHGKTPTRRVCRLLLLLLLLLLPLWVLLLLLCLPLWRLLLLLLLPSLPPLMLLLPPPLLSAAAVAVAFAAAAAAIVASWVLINVHT